MNNKYLAIVLSIVAVIVVIYQVFLRKPTKNIQQQVNQSQQQAEPMYSTTGRAVQPVKTGQSPTAPHPLRPKTTARAILDSENSDEGLIIDYNSEVLLKRISLEMLEPYTKKELPTEFGRKIFSGGILVENKPTGPQYEREVEFKLNAIIIDESRRIAIINDKILYVGDFIEGAEVIVVVKSQVVLKIKNEQFVLSTNSRIKKIRLIGGGNK